MSHDPSRQRLGRGLEALIPKSLFTAGKTISQLPLSLIKPNPFQPRLEFDPEALERLADSIKQHGLNQPILVRKIDDHYELIAGERRLRACMMAQLDSVPAIIRTVSDKESLQLALIENLEREDLNSLEEAKGYARLVDEFDLTHQALSEIFSRSRSAISNALRLLNLPEPVQEALAQSQISEGHARSLLALEEESLILEAFEKIKSEHLNVRQIEAYVAEKKPQPKPKKTTKTENPFINLESALTQKVGAKVKIKGHPTKGQIQIAFTSEAEFQILCEKLGR